MYPKVERFGVRKWWDLIDGRRGAAIGACLCLARFSSSTLVSETKITERSFLYEFVTNKGVYGEIVYLFGGRFDIF